MKTPSVSNSTKAIAVIGIGLAALFCSTTMYAPPVTYGIISATPDLQTHVLTMDGTFPINRGNPAVTLANTPLTVTNFINGTRIYATLPDSIVPGTYVLTVSFGNNPVFTIDVTMPGPSGAGDGGVPHGMKEFTASDSWVVPSGVTRLQVEVWGAGGGGGFGGDGNCFPKLGGFGGAGAYSRTALTVAAGDGVLVTVGQHGDGGLPCCLGGPGGFSRVETPTSVITSGGGGGGGPVPFPCTDADNGSPGTPDPNAPIGRASASHGMYCIECPPSAGVYLQPASSLPASGSIDILGRGRGGLGGAAQRAGGRGTDGYVFIQW